MRAVLLLAHGTPDSLDQMPEYLARVRGGRPPSPALLEEMGRNYAAIGGRSPLTGVTRAQADALAGVLGDGTPVFVGMRNWHPFIAEAMAEAVKAGTRELLALPLAPQSSRASTGKYREAVKQALPPGVEARFVESWHLHPELVEAFAEKVSAKSQGCDAFVFTAHSLPTRLLQDGDPYAEQVAATAAAVAQRAGLGAYHLAWQSAGRTADEWLAPTLEQRLAELAAAGHRRVLVTPVGFVSDHTEILYDIDIQARRFAQERGLELARSESLNTAPRFIATLADLVRTAFA
jgi:ferrochelatase